MNEPYEAPEIFELGEASEVTLGCQAGACDCTEGKQGISVEL